MRQTPIQAMDTIHIQAPAGAVWRVLVDVGNYPKWWPRSLGVRLLSAGPGPVGCELEIRPSGGRPFRCRVEEVRDLESIRLRYYGGFIEGTGEWRIQPNGEQTQVRYALDVVARGWLVAAVGKIVNLAGVHSRLMKTVLQGLENVVRNQAQ